MLPIAPTISELGSHSRASTESSEVGELSELAPMCCHQKGIADRIEVTVKLKAVRVSGPPVTFAK
jgi:hypothetical protein